MVSFFNPVSLMYCWSSATLDLIKKLKGGTGL
jgi:hypothetical protein